MLEHRVSSMTTAIAASNRETPPIRKIRPHLPWACAATFLLTAAHGQTVFSSHFNNGSGSSGDKNAGVYHWTAAVGGGGTLDTSLAGAPASVGVSQGTTASTGVPLISGQSTAAGFLFALPDSAPGAMFLHNTNLSTTTDFQDAPQSSWFRSGPDPLTGLTVGNIAELAVYTRPASAGVVMRFAILAGGQWHVSTTPFTQGDLNRFEQHTLQNPASGTWHSAAFTAGTYLDTNLTDNPAVTLNPGLLVTGYGIHAETGTLNHGDARVRIDSFRITAAPAAATGGPLATLAGGTGTEEFKDVMELSDGTVLVAGSAQDLDWITAPKVQWQPLSLPHRNTGRTAFLMRLSSNLRTVLGVWHLPPGQVHDFRWIKGTHKPGSATGALYLSGACDTTSGDYFIAKLDSNFVSSTPSGFAWIRLARASGSHGDNLGLQPWDAGGDGRVVFTDETGGALRVFFLDAAGQLMKLPALRGSHWAASVALDTANRQEGIGSGLPGTTVSGITFPTDLRSWTDIDRLAILPDGNGRIKRGTWPLDLFTAVRDRNGGTEGTIEYGYTGYRSVGRFRIGGIAVNRETNDFTIGFNIQSRFWDTAAGKEQPDFEPAVVSHAADGSLKWWSRLYHEVIDTNGNGQVDPGETRLSSPDQYVDGLALDYSATPHRIVVLARCHGNNSENLWRGNTIAASPGATSFHHQFTGTEGDIHIGWIGKLRETDGTLLHASYLAGFFRNTTLTQAPYGDPHLDGWPSHNNGWPNLTSTRAEPGNLRTDPAGRVYLTGIGPRMVTTANAWQKLPKITSTVNEGISPWAQFVRVMAPALDTLTYSSALTGAWTYPTPGGQPAGADNTDLYGVFPVTGGLIVVGRQRDAGNPVPTTAVPPWGTATPSGISALLARLPFESNNSTVETVTFSQWINTQSGLNGMTGPNDDPDRDGIPNLVEFALAGGLAGTPNPEILPAAGFTVDEDVLHLTVSYAKNPAAGGITWQVEVSDDLSEWRSGPGHTEILADTTTALVVREASPPAPQGRRFMRLRVIEP